MSFDGQKFLLDIKSMAKPTQKYLVLWYGNCLFEE
tara:strand:+ start:3135 stop:3239 length:105 start_codon:yes stop_codon:yes gene_type:complete